MSLPALGLLTKTLDLEPGWAEAVVPPRPPVVTALGAIVLGTVAHEPGRRGLLLIPLLIGASALLFFLGDLLFPH